jgi:hypothetical protein
VWTLKDVLKHLNEVKKSNFFTDDKDFKHYTRKCVDLSIESNFFFKPNWEKQHFKKHSFKKVWLKLKKW